MSEQDSKPWYRQFWPWFLICLPGSAVVARLYTASLAFRTSDSLVVVAGDEGVDVVTGRNLAAERRATSLGLEALLAIDVTSGAVDATLTSKTVTDWPETLELLFSHPAFADRDQAVTLTQAPPDAEGNPTWSGHVLSKPDGRWYLVLRSDDNWRLSGVWSGKPTVRLMPAGASGDGDA